MMFCLRSKAGRLPAHFLKMRAMYRHVATVSPLSSAFNSKPGRKFNLSMTKDNSGLFLIPQLKDHSGFYLLRENAEEEADKLVAEAVSPSRTRKMVQIFDDLSDCLCRVADMSDFVRVGHPDTKVANAASDACVSLSGMVERLNTNVSLYKALKNVVENGDVVKTDSVDDRVAQLFLDDFELSGIHLDDDKRKKFVKLNEQILMVGSYFMQNCHKHTSIPKTMLPENIQHIFAQAGDNITVTGLYADHQVGLVREAGYKVYLYPDDHQESLLHSLLRARNELAEIVGFKTFSERALKGTLAKTPENVMKFLNILSDRLKDGADKDFKILKEIKKGQEKTTISNDLMPWDVTYLTGLARFKRCPVDGQDLAQYFSLGSCMEGLNMLFTKLFGVSLVHQEAEPGELWDHRVLKLAVVHEKEGKLGYIYCDFYERPGKGLVDCHYTIRGGRELADGSYQLPVVVLNLNFPQPTSVKPSLLLPGMLENLFHEFGHAMHSMLGRTKYQHVTGTRCSTDFAEVPSVLMEYFASDPRVLSTFARHYQTGEPLERKVLENVCSAKRMFGASEKQLQTFYSVLDQVYHGKHPLGKRTTSILADIQSQYYSLPYVTNTAWQLRFGHLVGYGAKYYSYLMSRAVASRIWHKCFKNDPYSRENGEKYRREMLSHGGGKPAELLIKNMIGETPSVERLAESLVQEISQNQEESL